MKSKVQSPRLRMLAGPNGSGKSTLKTVLNEHLLNIFINADELEAKIKNTGCINFSNYKITVEEQGFKQYCLAHSLLQGNNLAPSLASLPLKENQLFFNGLQPNSYHASAICNYIRDQLLSQEQSFSFETVMSHESKVDLLRDAQLRGYRTYLYFVATETPEINILRVKERVEKGGHWVPEDKIRMRYEKLINLLCDAIVYTSRAYIFDNSHDEKDPILIAEYDGEDLIARVNAIPHWFARTWERF